MTGLSGIPGFNWIAALAMVDNDEAFLRSLLARLVVNTETLLAQIEEFLDRGAPAEAARKLHLLHGTAGNLRAVRIAALAGDLETALHRDDAASIPSLFAELAEAENDFRRAVIAVLSSGDGNGRRGNPPAQENPAPEMDSLDDMIRLLRQRNLRAVDAFRSRADALAARLPEATYQPLARAVDALDFATALLILGNAGLDRPAGDR